MAEFPDKRVILVVGSNRGIGLGLVKRYLEQNDLNQIIVGSYRSTETPTSLLSLETQYPNLFYSIGGLDLSSVDTIEPFIQQFTDHFKRLDTLIINAGVYGDDTLDYDTFTHVMTVNVFSPAQILTCFKPLLENTHIKLGDNKITSHSDINSHNNTDIDNVTNIRVAIISSILGSSTLNIDDLLIYKASKAALNNIIRYISKSFPFAGIQVIDPGWVKTDMGGIHAPLDIKTSTNGIISIIQQKCHISSSVDHFYQWDGEILPW